MLCLSAHYLSPGPGNIFVDGVVSFPFNETIRRACRADEKRRARALERENPAFHCRLSKVAVSDHLNDFSSQATVLRVAQGILGDFLTKCLQEMRRPA